MQLEQSPIKRFFSESSRFWLSIMLSMLILSMSLAVLIGKTVMDYGKKLKAESAVLTGSVVPAGDNQASSTLESGEPEIAMVKRKIDGILVEPGKDDWPPIAVMIENHADSRPPAGLSKAQLVYEAEAEGGITRFLAVYAGDISLGKIGPVRSARPYYIDWAQELGAVYVHCGGSPDALDKIKTEGVKDMNEFYLPRYFWRDTTRPAPHNVYTSSDLIAKYRSDRQFASSTFEAWAYKEDAPPGSRATSSEIVLPFKKPWYSVKWTYDRSANAYSRRQNGAEHEDEDGGRVEAKNIIIQYVSSAPVDDVGRLEIKTGGSGQALVCRDGSCEPAVWSGPGKEGRTEFLKDTGQSIELNAGTTWVEVVPSWRKKEVVY